MIRLVVTRGYGNGTFAGEIKFVTTRGYALGEEVVEGAVPGGGDPDRSRRRRKARQRYSNEIRWRQEQERIRRDIERRRKRVAAERDEGKKAALVARLEADEARLVEAVAAAKRHAEMASSLVETLDKRLSEEAAKAKLARDEEAMLVLLLAA